VNLPPDLLVINLAVPAGLSRAVRLAVVRRFGVFRRSRAVLLAAGLAAFLAALLWRQPTYPAPWFDEGLNISTSAMLARDGLYALPDSEGPRLFDPAIQTGPTVLLPVALAFKLFGAEIGAARAVVMVFACLALVLYGVLARRLFGSAAMAVALLFLVIGVQDQDASFVALSRQVLGEVPALAFLIAGMLIWMAALVRKDTRPGAWLLAGLSWGLMAITKSQVLIVFPAFLALTFLADRVWFRCADWRAFMLPLAPVGACVGLWYLVQLMGAGTTLFQDNAAVLREGSALHVLALDPVNWRRAFGVLWRTGYSVWGVSALLWGWVLAFKRRSVEGLSLFAIVSFATASVIWFTALSIGWGRYTFYSMTLTALLLAGFIGTLPALAPANSVARRWLSMAGAALAAVFIVFNMLGKDGVLLNLGTAEDSGYQAMSRYLAESLPPDAVVDTWEWEFGLLTAPRMRHPPTRTTNWHTGRLMGVPLHRADAYRPAAPDVCYVLIGQFGEWTQLYGPWIMNRDNPDVSFGRYQLWHVDSCQR
jgi:4-amino-4-deoxy-L-arabinose transferase-like glycosyltransferase